MYLVHVICLQKHLILVPQIHARMEELVMVVGLRTLALVLMVTAGLVVKQILVPQVHVTMADPVLLFRVGGLVTLVHVHLGILERTVIPRHLVRSFIVVVRLAIVKLLTNCVASFDVVSLFTSVPVQMVIEVVRDRLEETNAWEKRNSLTEDQICQLLAFVLVNSFFKLEGDHYYRIFGCAMGSPVSAVITELVMQRIEKIASETSPVPVHW